MEVISSNELRIRFAVYCMAEFICTTFIHIF